MDVNLVVGRQPDGKFITVNFDAYINWDNSDPLEFDTRPKREGQNISEILHQYAAIDSIIIVHFVAKTPIIINHIDVYLIVCVTIWNSKDFVRWSVKPQSNVDISSLLPEIEAQLNAINNIVSGTARSILPLLKEECRQQVRTKAAKIARGMISHGQYLLDYLGEGYEINEDKEENPPSKPILALPSPPPRKQSFIYTLKKGA